MIIQSQSKNQSQLYTKLMKYQEHPPSVPTNQKVQKISRIRLILSTICPCFVRSAQYSNHEQTKSNLNTRKQIKTNSMADVRKEEEITFETLVNEAGKKHKHSLKQFQVGSNYQNNGNNKIMSQGQTNIYPINDLKQDKLSLLGQKNNQLLCKIKKMILKPAPTHNLYGKLDRQQSALKSSVKNIDKYWSKRYTLFSKFDEGISINQGSWPLVLSQVVSQYIASQVKCQKVANLCAGVGGEAIKLANTCAQVFVHDDNQSNLKCLYINSRVYGSQNIQILPSFTSLLKRQPQLMVISSFLPLSQSNQDPLPYLSTIFPQILLITHNFLLILPPKTSIIPLISFLSSHLSSPSILPDTCSLRVQKIYNGQQFQCIVVYFGSFLDNSVALNDQLNWVYRMLQFEENRVVEGKKLVRKVREMYGMVRLINFVNQALKTGKARTNMAKFVDYIRQNKLLPDQKMAKYIKQQPQLRSKAKQDKPSPTIQQSQSPQQEELRQKTISSISIPSQIQRISTEHPLQGTQVDTYKSATMINRETLKTLPTRSLIKQNMEEMENKLRKRKSEERRQSEDNRGSLVQLYPIRN